MAVPPEGDLGINILLSWTSGDSIYKGSQRITSGLHHQAQRPEGGQYHPAHPQTKVSSTGGPIG